MSEKPEKLIPRLFRFTEDDIRMIGEIRQWENEPSDASTVRLALHRAFFDVVREQARAKLAHDPS
jgi:hypothetical protein